MCNCCNGTGHEFESHGMKCKVVIRNNIPKGMKNKAQAMNNSCDQT